MSLPLKTFRSSDVSGVPAANQHRLPRLSPLCFYLATLLPLMTPLPGFSVPPQILMFQAATKKNPNLCARYETQGSELLKRGNSKAAKRKFILAERLGSQSPKTYFNLGTVLVNERDYDGAMWQMVQALHFDPKFVPAMGALSFILSNLGDNQSAVNYLQTAVKQVPSNSDLYVFLGSHQYENEDYTNAVISFRKAAHLDPHSYAAYEGLGLALIEQDPHKAAEATADLDAALRLNPNDARAHSELGKLALRGGNLHLALVHFRLALRLQPELEDAEVGLADTYQQEEKLTEAEKAFRSALRLNPSSIPALYGLATVLYREGLKETANPFFKKVQSLQEKAHRQPLEALLLKQRGAQAMQEGRFEDAAHDFKDALLNDPASADAAYNVGVALVRVGRVQEAIKYFRQAVRLRPAYLQAQIALAETLKKNGNPEARQELTKAELLYSIFNPSQMGKPASPDDATSRYNAAVTLLKQGKLVEATLGFQAIIQNNPSFAEAHYALGIVEMRQGDIKSAEEQFYATEKLDSQSPDAYNNLGGLLAEEHRYSGAMRQILEALRLNPRSTLAWINLSHVLIAEGDLDGAVQELQKAVQQVPGNAALYSSLGHAQLRADRDADSLQSFDRALTLNPQLSEAHCGKGEAFFALGRLREAGAEFETALKVNPENANAYYQLGKLTFQQGDLENASLQLKEAIRLAPGSAEAHSLLGEVYLYLKQPDAAEQELRTALRLQPDMVRALYGLGNLLQRQGKTQEAEVFLKRFGAIQQRKQDMNLVPGLNAEGNRLRRMGDLNGAVASYHRALAIDPSAAEVAYNLALVLAREGKSEEAIQALKLAIQRRPSLTLAYEALAAALKNSGDPSAKVEMNEARLVKRFIAGPSPQTGLSLDPARKTRQGSTAKLRAPCLASSENEVPCR